MANTAKTLVLCGRFPVSLVTSRPSSSTTFMESSIPQTTTNPVEPRATLLQTHVFLEPPPSWITQRTLDESFAPKVPTNCTFLLCDEQHHSALLESYYRNVYRLETLYSVQQGGQLQLPFDPRTEKLVIHSINRRRGTNVLEQASPDRLKFFQRESSLENLVVTGETTLVLVLEDVQIGDVLDVSYTVRQTPDLLKSSFSRVVPIPSDSPIRAFHFDVSFCPAPARMQWKSSAPALPPNEESSGELTRWCWTFENLLPTETERNVPAGFITNKWIQVSDCASWLEVAQAVSATWQETWDDPLLEKTATDIAARAQSPAERAQLALTFVQDEIRYLSVNDKLGGRIPSAPSIVLKRRFGDCKDKCFLLAHLFRKLGVSARPVLVNFGLRDRLDQFLPSPNVFNHVIIEYEIDGKRYWADGTSAMQGGSTPARARPDFKWGLPIGPDVQNLEQIPPHLNEGKFELRQKFIVDTSGRPSTMIVHITATGSEADSIRYDLAFNGHEAVAKRTEERCKLFDSKLSRVSPMEWHDDRRLNEIQLANCFELSAWETGVYLRCHANVIISALAPTTVTAERTLPLALPFPCRFVQKTEIEAPSLPAGGWPQINIRNKFFKLSRRMEQRVGHWTVTYSFETLVDVVLPEQTGRYMACLAELMEHLGIIVLFPKGYIARTRGRESGNLKLSTRTPSKQPAVEKPDATPPVLPPVAPALVSLARGPTMPFTKSPTETTGSKTGEPVKPTGQTLPVPPVLSKVEAQRKRPQSLRHGRPLVTGMFVALQSATILLFFVSPSPLSMRVGSAMITTIWNIAMFVLIWHRQNWARYLFAGLFALNCLLLALLTVAERNHTLFAATCGLAFLIRASCVAALLGSKQVQQFTQKR